MKKIINGKVYADGDLISFTHDSRRYTWRIEGLSDKNRLKLVRVRAKYIEKTGEADISQYRIDKVLIMPCLLFAVVGFIVVRI